MDAEYTIKIEFDDFITRLDLNEVIASIDRIIEYELLYFNLEVAPPPSALSAQFLARYLSDEGPQLSYLGIRSVGRGSLILRVLLGGRVAAYVAKRFGKGVDKSLFAEELERSGRITGDMGGLILRKINSWAERYVPKQRELGGSIKDISVQRRRISKRNKK